MNLYASEVSDMDIDHLLRLSFTHATEAKEDGNDPFGAIILDREQEIYTTARNTVVDAGSEVHHAEINAIKKAESGRGRKSLDGFTLVSSAEPCPMCASAIIWSGLSRLIYGVSIKTLIYVGVEQINIPCRNIFNEAGSSIDVTGPRLEEEGVNVFH